MNNQSHRSILNSNILSQIENHVIENDGLSLKLLGFTNEITVNTYAFPSSFDDDETQAQIKKLKYKSSVHLLNAAYRKLGITELSKAAIKQCLAGELEYWYLQISFWTPIAPELQNHFKTQSHHFMIFIGDPEPDDDEEDGLRMLYSSQLIFNYVQEFDRAIYLDLDATDLDENYQTAISQIESVIYGICKTIEIEIPPDLQSETLDQLIVQLPTLATFELLLRLMTRNLCKDSVYRKDAKQLLKSSQRVTEEDQMHWEIMSTIATYEMTYDSDWKFDPEDIDYGISEILGAEFRCEYPEATYSDCLFPYIQTELAKQGLILMNIDTFGDSYSFCIVNIADVDRILELAQSIDLKIERI